MQFAQNAAAPAAIGLPFSDSSVSLWCGFGLVAASRAVTSASLWSVVRRKRIDELKAMMGNMRLEIDLPKSRRRSRS